MLEVTTVELCTIAPPVTLNTETPEVAPNVTIPPVPPPKVSGFAPPTKDDNEIFAPVAAAPLFVVSIVTPLASVAVPVIVTIPLLVVRLPPNEIVPL